MGQALLLDLGSTTLAFGLDQDSTTPALDLDQDSTTAALDLDQDSTTAALDLDQDLTTAALAVLALDLSLRMIFLEITLARGTSTVLDQSIKMNSLALDHFLPFHIEIGIKLLCC